jgi:RNA polymerase sigma-70 factor (ECF subfamily)
MTTTSGADMDARPVKTGDRGPGADQVPVGTDLDQAASVFVGARPRLIEIAYRILGSRSETEDVVQEAWLRWQRTDRSVVVDPTGFLATTTARLALNLAQSARNRRETHAGSWLVERADPRIGPEARAERGEAVEQAVLLLLQSLTPPERAAYVLREAFGYPYRRIAEILVLTDAAARQLVRRARQHIAAERRRPVSPTLHRRLVLAFRAAADGGDVTDLERLLAAGRPDRRTLPRGVAAARIGAGARGVTSAVAARS